MRDAISLERCQKLHPDVRQEAIDTLEKIETILPDNIRVRVVQGLRTIEEQNDLYAQGRTKPGKIITKARGGKSFHNYGLAIDFALLYDKDNNGSFEELSWDINKDFDKNMKKDWDEVVEQFEAKGWEWGGKWRTFKDYPHVQKTFGYSASQLLDRYHRGIFISGTRYLKLKQ